MSCHWIDVVSALVFLYLLHNILQTVGPYELMTIVFQLSCLYIVGTATICLFVLFWAHVCLAMLA